jgi:hypothetical protein
MIPLTLPLAFLLFAAFIARRDWRDYYAKLSAEFDRDLGRCERVFSNPTTTKKWQRK